MQPVEVAAQERRARWTPRRVSRLLFEQLPITLSLLLGSAQALLLHWLLLALGRPFGLAWLVCLAVLLSSAHLLSLRLLRGALARRGLPRLLARTHLALGLVAIVLGGALAVAWAAFLPLAALLDGAGLALEPAWQIFRSSTALLLGALTLLLVWGFSAGQARVVRSRLRIELPGLDARLRGLRIVHLSDLHIGNGLEGDRLARMVADANALEPDIVALTGDLFDFDPRYADEGARALSGLRARLGVYAVLGNHDRHTGSELVAAALAKHAPNLTLLRGALLPVPAEAPLYVAGFDDPDRDWSHEEPELPELVQLAARRPSDGPVLLLVHRPECFPQAASLGFPLVLAGHTHGGQIALPTPGGRFNPARLFTRFHRGLYRESSSTLYVNRGYGVAGPAIRLHCPREIAILELV